MSEDFYIIEEPLQFVAQPYLFKPREASKFTILLHHTFVTLVAKVDLRSVRTVVWLKQVILDYKVINIGCCFFCFVFFKKHGLSSEGLQ